MEKEDQLSAETPGEDRADNTAKGGKGKRRQNSRRKILNAASKLFVERGYHDTRPQDISREAEVGHGTFYLHFADKRECFAAFVEEAQTGMQAEVDRWTSEATNFEEHIRGVLKGILTFSGENPGVLTAAIADPGVISKEDDADLPSQKRLVQVWADEWAQGLNVDRDRGTIYGDYDIPAISYAIVGFVLFTCRHVLDTGQDPDEVANSAARFLVRALKADD